MAAPRPQQQQRESKPQVEEREEVSILAVYGDILKKVEEVNKLSLTMDSNEDLAAMLKDVEVVKARVQSIMEKFTMQQEMDKAVEEYESKKEVNDGND